MSHEKIKSLFSSAVESVVSSIADYAVNLEKDFTCCKKFPADKLIIFLVSEGSSSTRNELLDFFGMVPENPPILRLTNKEPNSSRKPSKPFSTSLISLLILWMNLLNTATWQLTVPPQLSSASLNSLRLNIL